MPESFESMLAGMADAAVSGTRSPAAADVRRRGHQRTVHRRVVATAVAFVACCGLVTGGVMGKVLGSSPDTQVVPVGTAPPVTGPTPTGSDGTVPVSASPSPSAGAGAPSAPPTGVAMGIWRRTDGTNGYLIIYPATGSTGSAEIGISEAGAFPLCYGRMAQTPSSASTYTISDVPCGGNLAGTMTVTYTGGQSTTLVLHIPAGATGPSADLSYTESAAGPTGAQTEPAVVAGVWSDISGTVTMYANGKVGWSVLSHGAIQSGSGTVSGYFDGGYVVTGPCATGAGDCNVLQLQLAAGSGQLTVIGSYGPEVFTRKS
jgi:hypothetical protein